MKKRSKSYVDIISNNCNNIIDNLMNDESYVNDSLQKYTKEVYSINNLQKYRSEVKSQNLILEEKVKIIIYELNKKVKTIVANTGKRKEEIEFLGYKHTDMRNYEGIRPYPDNDNNKIISRLYNENDMHDKSKVSSYIYDNFLNLKIDEQDIYENGLYKNFSW